MYIHSYTAVFHSQLPFFCRISFSPIWFFFYLSFFYFDFPLYNKHRRNRTSRKFMPNAHFHFTFHIHLTFTNTNTTYSSPREQTQFWAFSKRIFEFPLTHSSWFVYTICFGFAFVALAPTDIRTRPSFMNVWRWRPQPCEFYLAAVGCAAQWNPSQWSGSTNLQIYFGAGNELTLISNSMEQF